MSAKDSGFNLDLLVEDAEERAKAAKQLRDIAKRFPDLLRQVCRVGGNAEEVSDSSDSSDSNGVSRTLRRRREPPTAAVRKWLATHPDGATRREIVMGVMDKVKSKAGKPSDVINAAITVLKRKGEISGESRDGSLTIYKLMSHNGAAD